MSPRRPDRLKKLFGFVSLGCASDLTASSPPFFRPVAVLRTSKIVNESTRDLLRQSPEPAPDSDPGARVKHSNFDHCLGFRDSNFDIYDRSY